jgi:dihydroorotate dehydrogenase (NAD+) catalytic subunit
MGVKLSGLAVRIGCLKFNNPVMAASGTFGYGQEYKDLVKIDGLGAIITKSITLKPLKGNVPPRIWESTAGMLNAIGLQNDGIEDFLVNRLPFLKDLNARIVVSIAGKRRQEYKELAKRLENAPVDAIEINISCPNVEHHSSARLFAQDAKETAGIVRAVRKATKKTVITKLSPNVTDITEIAKAAEGAGTDAISLINTLIGMDVDIATQRPRLGNITGGLSGPAIKPVALRMTWEAYKVVKIPIIGIGGIMSTEDALAFFLCGASAIQVGTANFVNPQTITNIIDGISNYLKKNKLKSMQELTGRLKT